MQTNQGIPPYTGMFLKRLLVIGIAVMGVGFLWHAAGTSTDKTSPSPIEDSKTFTTPHNPDSDHLLDSAYLEKWHGEMARIKCSDGADDYLRSIAKYDFAWDDQDSKFPQYFEQIQDPGVLVMISRKAKLQNGFGAYKHIIVTCDYDTQADKVIKYGQN